MRRDKMIPNDEFGNNGYSATYSISVESFIIIIKMAGI